MRIPVLIAQRIPVLKTTRHGTNNTLTIGDSGVVWISSPLIVGSGSGNNSVLVTGNNALLHTANGASIIGSAGSFNKIVFTGTNIVWDCGGGTWRLGQQIGIGRSESNTLVISGGSVTVSNATPCNVGYGVGTATDTCYNAMVVTNGGQFHTTNSVTLGYNTTNLPLMGYNTFTVTGTGSVWDAGGAKLTVGSLSSPSNQCLVDQGGLITNCYVTIGDQSGTSCGNSMIVTNGGRIYATTGAGAVTIGNYGTNNYAVVTGPSSLWDMGSRPLYVGLGTTTTNGYSLLRIDNGAVVSNASLNGVGSGGMTLGNTLVVTNGSKLYTVTSTSPVIGDSSSNNTMVVNGTNSLWIHFGSSSTQVGKNGGSMNTLRIENGAVYSNAVQPQVYIGASGAATNNSLIIDGGQFFYNHQFAIGFAAAAASNSVSVINGGHLQNNGAQDCTIGGPGPANSMLVDGAGSIWVAGNRAIYVGGTSGNTSGSNTLTISNGAIVTNVLGTTVGNAGSVCSNVLRVINGGQFYMNVGQALNVGLNSSGSSALISGNGTLFASVTNSGNIYIGSNNGPGATGNVVVVDNGASCQSWANVMVGRYSNSVGNLMLISNGAYVQAGTVRVNQMGSNGWYNGVQVNSGGVLEIGSSISVDQSSDALSTNGYNYVTNNGGVYQFTVVPTTVLPTITVDPPRTGLVYLTSGTISFRNVNGVSVTNNVAGSQLTNIIFSGANAFRLNNSTNSAVTNQPQSYTFNAIANPTNYAGLEMINGGTAYTNGNVTIGAAGWLTFSNTTAIMWGSVTNYGVLRIANSAVTFKRNLTLGESNTVYWTTNSALQVVGTLTLPTNATLNIIDSLGKNDILTMFQTTNRIVGSPDNWVGLPDTHKLTVSGDGMRLIVRPRILGLIFVVE